MLTQSHLVDAFKEVGLRTGDVVLVHSALRRLGPVQGGADTVIEALLEVVGPSGTLAVPTHTWKVVNAAQPVFHETLTPSNVGTLSNVFRLHPGVRRSLHPTHSIAAIGARAFDLLRGHEQHDTPCAPKSPYGRLREWNGKVLIIGVELECCTFFHGCEEWAELPTAVSPKPIQLYSITADGRVLSVPTRPHFVNTWDQYPRLEPFLVQAGILRVGTAGTCPLRLLDAARAADWLVNRLRIDPTIVVPEKSLDGTSLAELRLPRAK